MAQKTSDFNYLLPERLIASQPLADRSGSRMMVIHRACGTIEHREFVDFPEYLTPDDLVVLNDTRVLPARVFSDDGSIELICLDRLSPNQWRCMVRPGKKMRLGATLAVGGIKGTVTRIEENGDRLISWEAMLDLEKHGSLALPHYMGRDADEADRERYQTVFAKREGAIAAPTAGLHFTPELLRETNHGFITLHVGIGTFRPVKVENLEEHVMHEERFDASAAAVEKINAAERVFAVGTTVTRVLEHLALDAPPDLRLPPGHHTGSTAIFLHPPHQFRSIDALLTNFHLPQSTLLMLVSAFAGRELVLEAYRQAVLNDYRFYSYGDCMLLL